MPAQSTENLTAVEAAVQASLSGAKPLTTPSLSTLPQKVLLSHIDFKPASKTHTLQLDKLKSKYIVLNTSNTEKLLTSSSGGTPSACSKNRNENEENNSSAMSGQRDGDGLPTPRYVIYPADKLCLEWWPRRVQKIGAGLHNLGNTCFLNATLQCLSYTPPLVNHLLSEEHTNTCKQVGFCMMCELQVHIRRCYENSGHAIKPQSILQKLKVIAKHMHFGRQEDAHEFLRYVVDALQKSCLNGYLKLDKYSRETTVINQIFGGFLRSQVQCMKCKEKSNTYDPYLDISLDIKNVQSLERAFEKYVTAEVLDHDNSYMCTRCQRKVIAEKRFSIHKPSNVLTIQLKRFDYNRYFGKIVRHITFPEKLNLRPYMSIRQGEPIMYKLYGVLVHTGHSCTSGHYFAYVRPSNQSWYCMNDSSVNEVSSSRVFESEAYMLFYLRCKEKRTLTNFIGPQMPALQNNFRVVNGSSSHSSTAVNDRGTAPLPLKNHTLQSLHPSKSSLINTGSNSVSKVTSLPDKREKGISFGVGTHTKGDPAKSTTPDPNSKFGEAKPRIVMQIKNGIVTTIEKPATPGKSNDKGDERLSKLVPYAGDSESDQENKSAPVGSSPHSTSFPKSKSLESYRSGASGPADSGAAGETKVVFDQSLNATTSVPGNIHLLETSVRERNNNSNNNSKNNNNRDSRSLDRFLPSTSSSSSSSSSSPPSPSQSKDLTLKLQNNRHGCSPLKRFLGDPGSCTNGSGSTGGNAPLTQTTLNSTGPSLTPGSVLTCDTSSTAKQKVNSTTAWLVQSQESAVSPSLGSASSSSASMNSTTEWHVSEKSDAPPYPKLAERQHLGWTVLSKEGVVNNQQTLAKNDKGPVLNCTPTVEPNKGPLDDTSLIKTTNSSTLYVNSVTTTSDSVSTHFDKNSHFSNNNNNNKDKDNNPGECSDLLANKTLGHVLKLKKEESLESETPTVETNHAYCSQPVLNNLSPCPKLTAPPEMHSTNSPTDGPSSNRPQDLPAPLPTTPSMNSESSTSRHSHKKHKRHKRKRHKESSRHSRHDTANDTLDSEGVRRKRHRKHKHKSSSSDDRRQDIEGGPPLVKRRHRSGGHLEEEGAEYEWVERTKEHYDRTVDVTLPSSVNSRTEALDDSPSGQRFAEGPAEPPGKRLNNTSRPSHLSFSTAESGTPCKKTTRPPVHAGLDNNKTKSISSSTPTANLNHKPMKPPSNSSLYLNNKDSKFDLGSEFHSKSLRVTPSESLTSQPYGPKSSSLSSSSSSSSLTANSVTTNSTQKGHNFLSTDSKTSFSDSKSESSNHRHSDLSSDRTLLSSPSSGAHKHLKLEKGQSHYSSEGNWHNKTNVSSQRWDSHIHDGYKRTPKGSDNYKMSWDGSKNSRIANELEKNSHRAYGGQVTSWDGSKSVLSQDLEHERSRNKRYCTPDYNDDYDRGKAKKIKKLRLDHNAYNNNNGGVNSFQRLHEERNKDKWRYGQRMTGSSYGQHSSYHRPYQHYSGHGASLNHTGHYNNNHYMGSRHAYRH